MPDPNRPVQRSPPSLHLSISQPYFSLIQTKFIKDKKSEFYKGCEVGGGDAVDWLKSGESVLGLLILLETHKFKKK